MDAFFRKVQDKIQDGIQDGIEAILRTERHSHTHLGHECHGDHPELHRENRFHSFAPPSSGEVKWYVDGASYFWAVSEAIEGKQPESS
jgi:phospholipase D1/2